MGFSNYAHPCFCLILRVYPRRAFKRKAMEFLWVAGLLLQIWAETAWASRIGYKGLCTIVDDNAMYMSMMLDYGSR